MSNVKVVRKTKNYTTVDNGYLRSDKLTLKAKGLLTVVLSHNDTYQITISGLSATLKEGKDAIRNGIIELMDNGYCEREQTRNNGGSFSKWDYTFYEEPKSETPTTENPTTVNPTQRITNLKNNQSKNKSKTNVLPKETYRSFLHLHITEEKALTLINDYDKEKLDDILDKIENWKGNKKYTDLYLTAKNWLKREHGIGSKGKYEWTIGDETYVYSGTKEEYEKAYKVYTAMGMEVKLKSK